MQINALYKSKTYAGHSIPIHDKSKKIYLECISTDTDSLLISRFLISRPSSLLLTIGTIDILLLILIIIVASSSTWSTLTTRSTFYKQSRYCITSASDVLTVRISLKISQALTLFYSMETISLSAYCNVCIEPDHFRTRSFPITISSAKCQIQDSYNYALDSQVCTCWALVSWVHVLIPKESM